MKTFWWPLLCLNTFTKVSSYLFLWTCLWRFFCYSMQYGGRTVWESDKHSNRIIFKNTFPQKRPLAPAPVCQSGDGWRRPKIRGHFSFLTLNPPLHILFSYAASLLKLGRGHVTCLWRELGSGGRSWSVTATGMTDSRLPEKRCLKSAPLKLCISRHSGCEFGNTYSQATYFKSFLSPTHK